jgi:hypothetical protein
MKPCVTNNIGITDNIGKDNDKAKDDIDTMPLELEDFDDEVCVAEMRRSVKIAIDSGAGSHVMAPADLEGYALEPSPASIRGKGFVAANGGRIDNL